MFEHRNYKRFKRLYDYITDNKCLYTKEFDGIFYKYKKFHTKLGDRCIIAHLVDKSIYIAYHDYDNSLLFVIAIEKNGKIEILQNVIDEVAIFSAIYEIECLIYEKKEKKRGEMLTKLLSYYPQNMNFGLGYYTYGE